MGEPDLNLSLVPRATHIQHSSSGKVMALPRSPFLATPPCSFPPSFPPSIPPSLDTKLFEVTVFQQIVPIVGDNLLESWFTLPGTKIFQFVFFPQLDLSLTYNIKYGIKKLILDHELLLLLINWKTIRNFLRAVGPTLLFAHTLVECCE